MGRGRGVRLTGAAVVLAVLATLPAEQARADLGDILKEQLAREAAKCLFNGGCGGRKPGKPKPPRPAPDPAALAERQANRDVQNALNAFGFPAGGADGVLGRQSREAIRQYQFHMNYAPTGELTDRERYVLTEAHRHYMQGAAARPPYSDVVAQYGMRGLLRAIDNPTILADAARPPAPPMSPVPPASDPWGRAPAPGGGVIVEDPFAPAVTASVAEHCEIVELTTNAHQGPVTADTMRDPDQGLGEVFCGGRSFAIGLGLAQVERAQVSEAALGETCAAIRAQMEPLIADLGRRTPEQAIAASAPVAQAYGRGDRALVEAYGQTCLGMGYRSDDGAMALAAAVMLAGVRAPYGELVAYHLREGLAVAPSPEASADWYALAVSALERGAPPVLEPSRTGERVAVIRAATSTAPVHGGTGPIPGSVPIGQVVVPVR